MVVAPAIAPAFEMVTLSIVRAPSRRRSPESCAALPITVPREAEVAVTAPSTATLAPCS